MLAPTLLDLSRTAHGLLFRDDEPAWTALGRIEGYLQFKLKPSLLGQISPDATVGENVFIDEGTVVEARSRVPHQSASRLGRTAGRVPSHAQARVGTA